MIPDIDPGLLAPVDEHQGTHIIDSGARVPCVMRGAALQWPATQRWTFDYLATRGGDRPVKLVLGNRELGETGFVLSTFRACVGSLASNGPIWGEGASTAHLKEFDLLHEFPALRTDVDTQALLPPRSHVSSSAWIGPRGAHTGLHYDLLDNLAVLLRGAKRFYLARPGVVESQGALSSKYDRWARLADIGIQGLAARKLPEASLFVADLHPGDAIYVPKGWWHEVVNLESSIFLGGFFGSVPSVVGLWLLTGTRQLIHDATPFPGRRCTCHAAS
ncbi:cupin-like domain-containing protein [Polaromonas sp.]|uniref:cupin-like domain-containing protein n=1 Tax=Polaromonas sp. TaxID=1869339 RepID=UPI003263FF00